MKNAISWFEIPVLNLAKAQQFYETALPPGMGFIACMLDLDGNKIGLHSLS